VPEDFERTEPATPRRREESRKKGMVPQSGDLPMAFVLGVGTMGLMVLGPGAYRSLKDLLAFVLGNLHGLDLPTLSNWALREFWGLLMPFFGLALLSAVLGNIALKGLVLSLDPLRPQLQRINPVEGLKRVFGLQALFSVLKALVKVALLGAVAYLVLKGRLEGCFELVGAALPEIGAFMARSGLELLGKMSVVFLGIAGLEGMYNLWDYERKLRMTREELKEELKQYEGDPKVKSRMRSLHRRLVKHRMVHRVKEADVVVTNPTHLAVALAYSKLRLKAPMVVAKGKGWLAERIRQAAVEAGVPVVQNKPLAEVLYRSVEVGQMIPVDLYRAVAEVLAWVYRLRRYGA